MVLSLFCLKTERLSDLPEVRQVFGGRGSAEMCSKLPGVGDQAGHTCPPFKNALAHAQQGGLQAGSRAVQDSKGGIPRGSGQHWMEVGVSTWPHACLHGRSMELRAAMQQTKHPLSMDLSHSLLPAQGNKPTANPTLLWLFAPKSGCGISLC